ncbi:MAG: hypothetical protein CSA34_01680 [Desulfobulbus propionicus]|nr:MAG: hypothetical protein CSA34_01680 [Desulfobulbus propionicus]
MQQEKLYQGQQGKALPDAGSSFCSRLRCPAIIGGCLLAAVIILAPVFLSAHSLYIQSGRFKVAEGRGTPLFFCFGHHFPVDGALRRKKLHSVKVIHPDGSVDHVQLRDEKSLHSYLVTYEQPGTYTLVAETVPGYFAMYTDKKGRKRHSLKPLNTFVEEAVEISSSMRSSQWAKTYVVSGEPSAQFPAVVGLPLELVPVRDVSALKEGEKLEIQIYENGKPFIGEGVWDATYSGFSTEAEDMYIPQTQIAKGKFTVPLDVGGRWFIRFFVKTEAPEKFREQYLMEKRTATLVVEARNERRRPRVESE